MQQSTEHVMVGKGTACTPVEHSAYLLGSRGEDSPGAQAEGVHILCQGLRPVVLWDVLLPGIVRVHRQTARSGNHITCNSDMSRCPAGHGYPLSIRSFSLDDQDCRVSFAHTF